MSNASHNQAPQHEECAATIRELEVELEGWFTGAAITTQDQADMLGELLGRARKAEKAAQDACELEYRPLKNAADAVKSAYKPALDAAASLLATGKQTLGDWQRKKQSDIRRKAEEARQEAERQKAEAAAALQASRGDVEARREAEALALEAKETAKAAARIAREGKGAAKIGNRSLRTRKRYKVEITNLYDVAKWCWSHRREAMHDALLEIAHNAVMSDKSMAIPGVEISITEESI